MRRISHRIIGRFITNTILKERGCIYRHIFKFGNAIPDYNIFSYLKGWEIEHFKGHNYPNSIDYMDKLVKDIINKNKIVGYFKLGILTHYVTDAFTYTHNKNFRGGMFKHHVYEDNLHVYFMEFIDKMDSGINVRVGGNIIDVIKKEHAKYEKEECSIEIDSEYIFKMVNMVVYKMKRYLV